jgi:pyrrolidone-carboxylate peptidase
MAFRRVSVSLLVLLGLTAAVEGGYTNAIMLTGYWSPSNDMLRAFSTNPAQNPSGWMGQNWEGRGYDVYSYFPEFASSGDNIGTGDFEVDYQDTSSDFWRITNEIRPLAIITFGMGSSGSNWEIESRYRNLAYQHWQNDYRDPRKPTPSPPDSSWPQNAYRYSTLPMNQIRDAVNAASLGLTSWVDTTQSAGAFLCEYIGYHAAWYQALHASPTDEYQNFASGQIHVGTSVTEEQAIQATEVTLRSLAGYLDTLIPEPSCGLLLLVGVLALGRRSPRRPPG